MQQLSITNRMTRGKTGNDRVTHYMSQLSVRQKQKLFELYKLDFALFGYEPENTIRSPDKQIKANI